MKIAVDVGGVISKYPIEFKTIFNVLVSTNIEIYIMSDMHPKQKIIDMLKMNDFHIDESKIISADYQTHGENCKAIECEKLGIDILIDDFIGYVASGKHIRMLVMPNPDKDYYDESWKTDGTEGNFGRRRKCTL